MIVEPRNYTTEEFIEYIINNRRILKNERGKKWLKMYSFITDVDWQNLKIFGNPKQLGQVYQIEIKGQKHYLIEPQKGWIVLFSIANDDVYRDQIEKVVQNTPGIMEFWVKPPEFEKFIDGFLNKTNSLIYRFSSRTPPRLWEKKHPNSRWNKDMIRPNRERRISYSGRDATEAMYEIRDIYGTVPETVYLETNKGIKMRIKNDGLFAIQRPSEETLGIYYKMVEQISKEVLKLRDVGVSIKTDSEYLGHWQNSVSRQIGEINIVNDRMVSVKDFKDFALVSSDRYKHYNTLFTDRPFSVTSEIYDSHKNSIMHADITRNSIVIGYPVHGRFDTTLGYFKQVLEYVDPNAELVLA